MTPEEILAEHVVDIRRIVADFRDAFERTQTSSTRDSGVNKFSLLSLLCRGGLVFTTGILDRRGTEDAIKKLRESGTSSLYKKLLTTSTTQSYMNAFT